MSLLVSHPSCLPIRVFLPLPITYCSGCIPRAECLAISTPRYVYWSTIGTSSSPYFQLKFTGLNLSSLPTTTAHFNTFADTLHLLSIVYDINNSVFSVRFCNPSGVSDIPTKSSANINPDTVASPTVAPCCAASAELLLSGRQYNIPCIGSMITYIPVQHPSIFPTFTHIPVILFTVLHVFPPIPVIHNLPHNPLLSILLCRA